MYRSVLFLLTFLNCWLVIVSNDNNKLEDKSIEKQKYQDLLYYEFIYSDLYFKIKEKLFDVNERNLRNLQLRNISNVCLTQISKLVNDLQTRETWALQGN